ncbi:hypothetical protein [Streptomyces rochei]|uniref:hypothetical protein n=1 Tax=Streptomyces rochei TaxID=1928 RepID=UPI0037025E53
MTNRARTHIKAMAQTLKEELQEIPPEQLAQQPTGALFLSGIITGLAASVQVLDGGTAEQAMETIQTNLETSVGRAYLNGTLPAPAPDTDKQLSREDEIRGVQRWMALDLHQALGLPVDGQAEHQGHSSWADWWADLCGHVAQRTAAAQVQARRLAVPDSLTFRNARQWNLHPEDVRPERLFFPIRYGAFLAEAHPISPNDPPCMIDLVGYEDGDPLQERVLRLVVHRSLTTRLARDLAAADTTAATEASEPGPDCRCHNIDEWCSGCRRCPDICGGCDGATAKPVDTLGALVETAKRQMVAELGESQRDVDPLEALAYHATGLSDSLEQAESERDGAYRERAHLVALLAAMTDGAVIAPAPDVDEPGWQIAYLTIGGHQASWHISPRDADLVAHIDPVEPDDPRAQWDGHSTELKYARIAAHTAELAERCGPACAEGHTYTGRCEGAHPCGVDDSEATAPDIVHPVTEPQASSSQQVDEPCVQHPNAPVIGGMCGGCTQYPADMVPVSIQEQRDVQQ